MSEPPPLLSEHFIYRQLTEEELARFADDGYLLYGPILTERGLEAMRNECMAAWNAEKSAFNADGSERMEHRKADCVEPAQHLEPAIAVSESGRVLVFWDDTLVGQSPRVSGRAFDE